MEHRQVRHRTLTVAATVRSKHPGCPVKKLCLPLGDLVRVNVELLSKLGQRLVALYGGQSHLRLEGRCVVPAWSFGHRLSWSPAILAVVRQKLHLSRCSDFLGQLCWRRISTS